MEAVALFSFPAAEADELSFQEGDIIKVRAALLSLASQIWQRFAWLRDCTFLFIGDRNGGRFWLVHSRNPGEARLHTTELHLPPPLPVKKPKTFYQSNFWYF